MELRERIAGLRCVQAGWAFGVPETGRTQWLDLVCAEIERDDIPKTSRYLMSMYQIAPYPVILADLVSRLKYRSGWHFNLEDVDRGQGSKGLTLIITVHTVNSYDQDKQKSICHYMLVPPAAFDERSWRRWLFEQILQVETHEAMEFFTLSETPDSETSVKPYAPSHGDGNDPYMIRELGTDIDRRTSSSGELNPE